MKLDQRNYPKAFRKGVGGEQKTIEKNRKIIENIVCSNPTISTIILKANGLNGPIKRLSYGAPGWRSRLSVRLQPGHHLAVREFKPRIGLWADGSEPGACFRFCVSLSSPPPFMLCLSLSQK